MIQADAPEFPQVRWDLSDLFSGMDDPKVAETWTRVRAQAEAFAERWRGKIASGELSAAELAQSIRECERLSVDASKPVSYAGLVFSTESTNPKAGAFMAEQRERASEITVMLLFFTLELQEIPDEAFARLRSDAALADYGHWLDTIRSFRPHKLSEPEERILEETANTGSRAWERLFDEVTAAHVFRVTMPGGEAVEKTEPEVLAMLREPNRDLRLAAAQALTQGLTELQQVLVFTYNTLLQDKRTIDRLRSHPYPEHDRHLSNELSKEAVDLVVDMCREHYGLVERFYLVKREILGLPELTHVDRYAPLEETTEKVTFEEARAIIRDAIGAFSPTIAEAADQFFDREWIDAEPRKGKQGGAYCHPMTPDMHPVVFMNYQNKMDDVMTLAHELGHGVHGSLSHRLSFFNFHPTLPMAELASTFAEMLVFEKLVAAASPKEQLSLYAEKIEGIFATVFRQAAMYHFELRAHRARAEGELSADEYSDIWQEELQAMFGRGVSLGEEHRKWWMYISHFFTVPFYVYSYSFGELVVLSLFQMAKEQGRAFAEKYEKMLSLGGSLTPAELLAVLGADMNSPEFWKGGFVALEGMVERFEALRAETR